MLNFRKITVVSLAVMLNLVSTAIAPIPPALGSYEGSAQAQTVEAARHQLILLMHTQKLYRLETDEFAATFDQIRHLAAFSERTFEYAFDIAATHAPQVVLIAQARVVGYPSFIGIGYVTDRPEVRGWLCELPGWSLTPDGWLQAQAETSGESTLLEPICQEMPLMAMDFFEY